MIAQAPEVTYESICDECRELVGQIDLRRWRVGDRAILIEKQYGEHTLDDFARDIGMNKNTVYGWRRVAEFYPEVVRRTILNAFPNLTYAYYKDALRCGDLDLAITWLEKVSAEGWSADQAAYKLTVAREKGINDGGNVAEEDNETNKPIEGTVSERIYKAGGKCVIEIAVSEREMRRLETGDRVSNRAN